MTRRPCLAITLGDPCGIGPELLLRTLHAINRWAEVVVIGARAGLDLLGDGAGGTPVGWRWGAPAPGGPAIRQEHPGMTAHGLWTSAAGYTGSSGSGPAAAPRPPCPGAGPDDYALWLDSDPGFTSAGYALWLDPTPDIGVDRLQLGQGSAASGRAAVEAVRLGAALAQAGQADALVTLPLAKSAAHLAGYPIPGHTEFLQSLCGSPISRMAFVSPRLSVVLHTVHQSLRSVVEELKAEAVAETLAFAAERFIQLTGKLDLKIALCALNPHAGENGAFGHEEAVLDQAILAARHAFLGPVTPFAHVPSPFGLDPAPPGWSIFTGPAGPEAQAPAPAPEGTGPRPEFFGPLPSDTLFQRAARGQFDLVVALYHDQGLIPVKVLEPDRAVNLTLGLPYVRTSPDHGTAFDRAGTWTADPANFMEAAALAVRLAGRAKREPWRASAGTGGAD